MSKVSIQPSVDTGVTANGDSPVVVDRAGAIQRYACFSRES